jgi:hypothetical protein
MWQWLSDNANTINVLANAGMLIVWVTYLQVFLAGYRRERRAKILVNRGGGTDLRARCLLSNMSAEPIYIQSIVARLQTAEASALCQLTDLEHLGEDAGTRDPMGTLKQGPLGAGCFIDIGTFEDVVRETIGRITPDEQDAWRRGLQAIEIIVVAVYGPDKLLAGAERRFECRAEGESIQLRPTSIGTSQIRSRRARRNLENMLLGDLCRVE